MSDEKSSGCLKAFMIFCVLNVLLMGTIGAGYYALWKKNGSPSLEVIQELINEQQGFQLGEANEESEPDDGDGSSTGTTTSGRRPIVATTPIQGNSSTYSSYTARKDVMTLVNYYSDT